MKRTASDQFYFIATKIAKSILAKYQDELLAIPGQDDFNIQNHDVFRVAFEKSSEAPTDDLHPFLPEFFDLEEMLNHYRYHIASCIEIEIRLLKRSKNRNARIERVLAATPPTRQFVMTSSSMRVSDPCYSRDVLCTQAIQGVKQGRWTASVRYCVGTPNIAELYVCHDEHWKDVESLNQDSAKVGTVGVDAGLCGFFDDALYSPQGYTQLPIWNRLFEAENGDLFCFLATDENSGVFSSTAFGDGSYPVYTTVVSGEVVFAKLKFAEFSDEECEFEEE